MSFHAQRFGRAALTYDSHAEVQSQMADTLITLLPPAPEQSLGGIRKLLEMGCGTGILTKRLQAALPDTDLLATDASATMLAVARERFSESISGKARLHFSIFDASGTQDTAANPPLFEFALKAPFDLAASNAMVQWFPNLSAHLQLVSSVLSPRGIYLVSGFCRDNFPELNALLAEPPFNYQDFPGHHRLQISQAAQEANFKVDFYAESSHETRFPTPEAFLASIRGLGSSRRPGVTFLTQGKLSHLVERYRTRFPSPGGVKATWKPWYARLSKANSKS